jgi:hypothetical protein
LTVSGPVSAVEAIGATDYLRNIISVISTPDIFAFPFYGDENLEKVFRAKGVTSSKDKNLTQFYLIDVPIELEPWSASLSPRTEFHLIRFESNGSIEKVVGSINFQGRNPSGNFSNVTKELGLRWVEDIDAEQKTFQAIAREPFNPPAKPQRIIRYDCSRPKEIECNLVLDFGSNDEVNVADFSVSLPASPIPD